MKQLEVKFNYQQLGGHTHCVVFCNGRAGALVFSNEEFETLKRHLSTRSDANVKFTFKDKKDEAQSSNN